MTLLAEFLAAHPELAALPHDQTSAQTIADAMNAAHPRTRVESTLIGFGSVMDSLGPVDGAALLDALDALRAQVSMVKWAWVLLEQGRLDVGLASTRQALDALTGDGKPFSALTAAAIKNLAVVADPYTAAEVEAARG